MNFFVEPVLVFKEGLDDLAADVILVSARGAAGKSRTAAELARRAGAPLWRLERDAAVSRAALPHAFDSYLSTVNALATVRSRSEAPAVLIDSLDEARSRVSAQSWDEFLQSLANASEQGLRLVLFGRDRTLEEVWLKLTDAGRTVAWMEVSHFPVESQKTYIDGLVSHRGAPAAIGGRHYAEARDALLSALAGSVTDDTVETFVGYAPVLDAVAAVLVDEQNHYKLAQDFRSRSSSPRHIDVLRDILDSLLIREQGKLEPLSRDLGLPPQSLYTPQEQIEWLWHDITGTSAPKLHQIVDPAADLEYRKQLRPFLNDHPFRSEQHWASVVFEAYAAAFNFEILTPSTLLLEVGNHSGLLFDFVSTVPSEQKSIYIDEPQFAALHSSILAGEYSGSPANVSLIDNEQLGFVGHMEVVRSSGPLALNFDLIPENSTHLTLAGPLESLTVVTESGIRIAPLRGGRAIGPDLYLRATALRLDGDEARFARIGSGSTPEFSDSRFEIEGKSIDLPSFISVAPMPGTFELAVPEEVDLIYPWTTYRVALEQDDDIDPQSKAIRFLNKLQNLARTHGHTDGRATYFMKLQGRQPLKSAQLRNVLKFMEKRGALRMDGDLVFLTPEADKHRFSGKSVPGQQTIEDEWTYWGPIVRGIEEMIAHG
ncbi:hypothetical protein ABC270_02535 [Curtobacterium sp. 1P10AnD]|uniref:hypothetical protein n=1 Tax=Curtobacterium sp. 1P10AnD TaxID=3132283 RepID=UPI00399EF9E4